MIIKEDKQQGVKVLLPSGHIDHANCAMFESLMQPHVSLCKAGEPAVLLDFSQVDYISSVGLRVLMQSAKQVKTQNGKMVIAGLTPVVAEIFKVGRFNLIYQIYDSVADALAALT